MDKIAKYLRSSKFHFIDLLYILVPLLVLPVPIYTAEITNLIKIAIFSLIGLWSIGWLVPLLFTNLANLEIKKIRKIFYYIQVGTLCLGLIIITQLLKTDVISLNFTAYLALLFSEAVLQKLKQEKTAYPGILLFTFGRYFLLIFFSFFSFTAAIPLLVSFMATSFAFFATALRATEFYSLAAERAIYNRLPALLYLCGLAILGIMSIIPIIHPAHLLCFLTVPLLIKSLPSVNKESQQDKEKSVKIAHIVFAIILLCFVVIRLFL